MQLTASQQRAISGARQNLQLIACAGSGKTEVVARRVAHLLSRETKPTLLPSQIVAFTFTNKAAAELKHRIQQRVNGLPGDKVLGMADLYVGTIHGYCGKLLQDHVPEYLKFELLNEMQQQLFIQRNSRASGLTSATRMSGRPLHRFGDAKRYLTALNVIREDDVSVLALSDCSVYQHLEQYEDLLRHHGYFD